MSTLDGLDLFSTGPHSIRPESWERAIVRRGFPGLDGELLLDLGLRSRTIAQTGRLQGESAAALQAAISRIESFLDGRLHVLVGSLGRTFSPVVVEHFEATTPPQVGRGHWCDYVIRYRQLP